MKKSTRKQDIINVLGILIMFGIGFLFGYYEKTLFSWEGLIIFLAFFSGVMVSYREKRKETEEDENGQFDLLGSDD
jgi:Ca2+/Na+ antiporter